MRENLTPESIASDIHMRRSQFKGTFLIVEGDTDQRFYGRFIDEELCQTVAANGKPSAKQNAIRVIEILRNENFDGALAIVDADFSRLEGKEPDNDHIFMTDTHDLETIILKSPAYPKGLRRLHPIYSPLIKRSRILVIKRRLSLSTLSLWPLSRFTFS